MRCSPTHSRGKIYLYYRCPGSRGRRVKPCSAPSFRVDGEDGVDALVWDWVKDLLTDPTALREGLEDQRNKQNEENQPLRDRLDLVQDLLSENEERMERLVELYLDGTWDKDWFKQRETQLRETIESLRQERDGLKAQLDARTITEDQIRAVEDVAQEVAGSLDSVEDDFDTKRRVIDLLDVRATLAEEDGEKVLYVRCVLKGDRFWRLSNTSRNSDLRSPQPQRGSSRSTPARHPSRHPPPRGPTPPPRSSR
jgi:hypothetical protein